VFRVIFERERGQRVPIRVWARTISAETTRQLQRLASQHYVVEFVAAMADAHVAEGVAVGSVFATERTVVPRALGGDLGCGMSSAIRRACASESRSERARRLLKPPSCEVWLYSLRSRSPHAPTAKAAKPTARQAAPGERSLPSRSTTTRGAPRSLRRQGRRATRRGADARTRPAAAPPRRSALVEPGRRRRRVRPRHRRRRTNRPSDGPQALGMLRTPRPSRRIGDHTLHSGFGTLLPRIALNVPTAIFDGTWPSSQTEQATVHIEETSSRVYEEVEDPTACGHGRRRNNSRVVPASRSSREARSPGSTLTATKPHKCLIYHVTVSACRRLARRLLHSKS
jgi:hypothetical protein